MVDAGGERSAGFRDIYVDDHVQGARMLVRLLYPTRESAAPHAFGPFMADVAIDAAIDGDALRLVVVSHGTGGTPWTHRDLALHLARGGFVVALVQHPGNHRGDDSLANSAINLQNRPRHVRLAIDAAFADEIVGAQLVEGVAMIGHSLGGYTALAIAGGIPSSFPNESPSGVGGALEVEHDDRVCALVLLAPATVWFMAEGALQDVHGVPILMRTGDKDSHADASQARVVERGLPDATLLDHVVVPGAGHYSFLSAYPEDMKSGAIPPSQDPAGFDRAAYLPLLFDEITAFLHELDQEVGVAEEQPAEQISRLERELRDAPDAAWRYFPLLGAFCAREFENDPRRLQHILAALRLDPRDGLVRTPLAHVDPHRSPEAFNAIEREWLELRAAYPRDAEIARGLALFVANQSISRAVAILEDALTLAPDDHGLWVDLGRHCADDPPKQLAAFREALRVGSTQPNLMVWIGRAAYKAGELDEVQRIGETLRARVADAEAVEDPRIDWTATGIHSWRRLRRVIEGAPDRSRIVHLVSDHANDKHWSHTFLGLVAEASGDLDAASTHLRESARVIGEPRLASYGPSLALATALCKAEQWPAVADFLRACSDIWDDEPLDAWIGDVEAKRVPDSWTDEG
ncbi:MAG: hypothetical protein IAG13_21015 [Deltaproteobacteria bacterium]|nr:hypothetical protein [Nannocystaceae bacterium]